jgi:hypothetical protein
MPIIIPVWLIGAIVVATLGRNRRFGFWGYFFASLLLTPIIGLLMLVAAIPTKADVDKAVRKARKAAKT